MLMLVRGIAIAIPLDSASFVAHSCLVVGGTTRTPSRSRARRTLATTHTDSLNAPAPAQLPRGSSNHVGYDGL